MLINANGAEYELKTTLGVTKKIEEYFAAIAKGSKTRPLSIMEIFSNVSSASVDELLVILGCGIADKAERAKFTADVLDGMDYMDLQMSVQQMLARLLFSGSPEQQEEKISKYPVDEQQKNAMRGFLDLPLKEIELSPASENGSEPLHLLTRQE